MSHPRSVRNLLGDIDEWGSRIADYVAGMSKQEFAQDQKTQDAVIRCLEVLGEAAGKILKIAPDFPKKYPDLTLAEAYRARNRTAHGYGSVDLETVWSAAIVAAPILVAEARKIVDELAK